MAKEYTDEQKKIATTILSEHVKSTEDSQAWVTDRVAFMMPDLIRQCRRNYWGVFKKETDRQTGRKKIWMPLTEMLVEQVVKNIDMDTKDIRFRTRNPDGYAMTAIVRAVVRDYLDRRYFGEDLDNLERDLCIDGTVVWKTYTRPNGQPEYKQVDLLNFYIDPQADSIQETTRVAERAVMPVSALKKKDWHDTDDLEGAVNLPKVRDGQRDRDDSGVEEIDVWELWGLVPNELLGIEGEGETEGHIVISGLEGDTDMRVHLIEENKEEDDIGNIVKPYEEAWYHKVSNRWYGRGIAEKVMMLQMYLNTITNIRINRSYISQLGLFKIKEGSGITPEQISNLSENGAVVVNNMDDIEQWVMQEASTASYRDEDNILTWSQRLTSAFQVVTGEQLPSSTTATNVSAQLKGAKSAFSMVKKGVDSFMQRWMDRHMKSKIVKQYAKDDLIRVVGDDQDLRKVYDRAVAYKLRDKFEEFRSKTRDIEFNSPRDVQEAINEVQKFKELHQKTVNKLREQPEVFVKLMEEITAKNLDTYMYMTNEEIDTGTTVKNLVEMMKVADPSTRKAMTKSAFDLLGLPAPELDSKGPDEQMTQEQAQQMQQQVSQSAGRGGARQGAGQMRTTGQPRDMTEAQQLTANNVRQN